MTETQTLLGSEPNGESQTQPRLLPELTGINFNMLKKSITFRNILKLGDVSLEGGNTFSEFMKEICPNLKKDESMVVFDLYFQNNRKKDFLFLLQTKTTMMKNISIETLFILDF